MDYLALGLAQHKCLCLCVYAVASVTSAVRLLQRCLMCTSEQWRERREKGSQEEVKKKSAAARDGDAVMEETFGNREPEENEMNECGSGIEGG